MFNHGWWLLAIGGWRLAVGGGWWRLAAVGGWWLVVGSWWRLAVVGGWRLVTIGGWRLAVGGWRLAVGGGWWRLAVGGWWRLVVGGWWSLRAVLKGGPQQKKIGCLKDRPASVSGPDEPSVLQKAGSPAHSSRPPYALHKATAYASSFTISRANFGAPRLPPRLPRLPPALLLLLASGAIPARPSAPALGAM